MGDRLARAGDFWQRLRGFGAVLVVLLLQACAGTRPQGEELPAVVRSDQVLALPAGTARILVDNPWGDIHVRRGPGGELSHHAVIQQLAGERTELQVEPGEPGGEAKLTVRFARSGDDCRRKSAGGSRIGRVDLTVFVPPGVDVELRSDCDGRLSSDHVLGRLTTRNGSGGVNVSAAGGVDIVSESGRVRAWVELAADSVARSGGPVILTLPVTSNGEVDVSACGELIAEGFEWIGLTPFGACQHARARFGDGGPKLLAGSSSAFVEIRLRGAQRP